MNQHEFNRLIDSLIVELNHRTNGDLFTAINILLELTRMHIDEAMRLHPHKCESTTTVIDVLHEIFEITLTKYSMFEDKNGRNHNDTKIN